MKILKKVGIVFLVLIILSAIGNVIGGSKKGSSSSSAKTESKTESKVESAAASTATESAAAQAVEATAAAPAKSQRNGFDQATNQTYEYQGFAFSLPSYMTPALNEKGGVRVSFNGEAQGTVSFGIERGSAAYSAEQFESMKTDLIDKLAENLEITWQSTSAVTIAGCSGMSGTAVMPTEKGQSETDAYIWYDNVNTALFIMYYIESDQSTYTYSEDVKKLVASVAYTGNGLTTQEAPVEEPANTGANDTDVPAGVTPEFKAQMDEYEAFFDEYVEFMQKYSSSDNPVALMSEYLEFMQKYTKYMEALDAIDESTLSDADALYFAQVNLRIEEKLLAAMS
jgi:Na+-transporting methylmalonyl-CoA/oxaloacetate decarboxylase gamma subunit